MKRIVALAVAGTLGLAGSASAAQVTVQYQTDGSGCPPYPVGLTFAAGPGEANHVVLGSVARDAGADIFGAIVWNPCGNPSPASVITLVVQDMQNDIAGGAGCGRVRPRAILCNPVPVVADLGDRDDRLYASGVDHRVSVLAGPGADTVDVANGGVDSVACGPGADTVVADAWDAVAADCETVQRTPV